MRRSCLPETSDRRLRVQSGPVRSPAVRSGAVKFGAVKSGAVTAALVMHGGAVAMLLLAHPLPTLDPVPELAVEVVLSIPAPPEEEAAPAAAQAPAVPAAADDPAEEQHAGTLPDTAAPQGSELPRGAPAIPETPVAEVPAADAVPARAQEPAQDAMADPPPAFVAAKAPQPPVEPVPVVAEAAPDAVPATVQGSAQPEPQLQIQPAPLAWPAPQRVTVQRRIRPARPQVRPLMEAAAPAPRPARPGTSAGSGRTGHGRTCRSAECQANSCSRGRPGNAGRR